MDIDIALRENEPPKPIESSTSAQKTKNAKWERTNHMFLMIMQRSISEIVIGALPKTDSAREFFDAIGKKYMSSDKAKIEELLDRLMGMKFDNVGDVRTYVMKWWT